MIRNPKGKTHRFFINSWPLARPKNCEKEAVNKSAASAASTEGFASRLVCMNGFGPSGAKSMHIVGNPYIKRIKR